MKYSLSTYCALHTELGSKEDKRERESPYLHGSELLTHKEILVAASEEFFLSLTP